MRIIKLRLLSIVLFFIACEDKLSSHNIEIKERLQKIKPGNYTGELFLGSDSLSQKILYLLKITPENNTLELTTPPGLAGIDSTYISFRLVVEEIENEILYVNIILNKVLILDELLTAEFNKIKYDGSDYHGFIDIKNEVFNVSFIIKGQNGQSESYLIIGEF